MAEVTKLQIYLVLEKRRGAHVCFTDFKRQIIPVLLSAIPDVSVRWVSCHVTWYIPGYSWTRLPQHSSAADKPGAMRQLV
jgi:hypothetical protein